MPGRATARERAARGLTLKEWADLPEDAPGEWVDGFLEEEEVANQFHERAVAWLIARFLLWLEPRGGSVTGSEIKYGISSKRGRKPDLSIFLPGRARVRGGERLTMVPPDIAIEVITPTPRDARRDRVEKAREYSRFGVRWYWLVDPAMRTVEIFELVEGRYVHLEVPSAGSLKVPGCRNLRLDLDALWRYLGPVED